MARPLRIAAAQYPIERPESFDAWVAKIECWVADAVRQGAEVLVFPEYAGMELAGLLPDAQAGDLRGSIRDMQLFVEPALALHEDLARRHGVIIVQGSLPVATAKGYVNRANVLMPHGKCLQDKHIMTRFEREDWGISGGMTATCVFHAGSYRFGVAICLDSEFPLIARAMIEAGAELILVPSCTDTLAGYHRVRIGAQARALEGQCVTVQSPTIGNAEWSPAVDVNIGAAGIFGPPDKGFPEDGVLALGRINKPGWLIAGVDLDKVQQVRRYGAIKGQQWWDEQPHGGAQLYDVTFDGNKVVGESGCQTTSNTSQPNWT